MDLGKSMRGLFFSELVFELHSVVPKNNFKMLSIEEVQNLQIGENQLSSFCHYDSSIDSSIYQK